jgi:ParB-like chromosome segregation protein Spo0J
MELKQVNISDLKPHPKNPRKHPDSALGKLKKSIKEFGFTNPVLVSEDGFILAGHARLKAAEKAGLTQVPVIELPLSGAKADAYMIADNKLQDLTEWDIPTLDDLLQELSIGDIDLELTGFSMDEIERLTTGVDLDSGDDNNVQSGELCKCPKCGFEFKP